MRKIVTGGDSASGGMVVSKLVANQNGNLAKMVICGLKLWQVLRRRQR